ncbi:2-keto-4-pentenoate hydratase [Ensifer adhaerens]|uniref:Fumarylacetoacetate hydrolase family protein n=1 Tax=Ensifer adhaerens TaxID=106592 RepID=A0A9Q8YHB1_ENSAD|nr:fumarylacetoacetate hydrolase family protein [Ensifer adhaerens]USJ28516.1 fumarylacetoacetate hydrolase family protein [Ensifer adhaerens]
MKRLESIASTLDEAARQGKPVPQFTGDDLLSTEEAYAVQQISVGRRHQRGERPVGYKMGLTSRAKMQQVGVSDVIWGRLTDHMRVEDGGIIDLNGCVHPRAEPEIAFLIGGRLSGNVSIAEAMSAVVGICPAIEIIDSRYENFKFALGDVIADNTSACRFVLGPWSSPATDIANLGMILEIDGKTVAVGSSAGILGHPGRALVAAARMIGNQNLALEPGDILLAGAATEAFPIRDARSVRATVQKLGSTAFQIAQKPD